MVLIDTDFLFSLLRNFNKGGSMNNANYEDNQNDWIFTLYFIVFYPYVGSVCFVGFYAYLNLTTTELVDRVASGDFKKSLSFLPSIRNSLMFVRQVCESFC